MMDQNPYEPTMVEVETSHYPNPMAFGLRFGALFASPLLLVALAMLVICILRRSWNDLWLIGLPLPLGLAIMFCGGWWGYSHSKISHLTFIAIAVVQGLLQCFIFFGSAAILTKLLKGFPEGLPSGVGFPDILITSMAYAFWSLMLGLVIKWRLRKRVHLHSSQNA